MATMTVSDFATALDTDARTARKFLRTVAANDDSLKAPGKGGRWEIEKRKVASLKKQFAEYTAHAESLKAAREAKANEALEQGDDDLTIDDDSDDDN